MVRKLAGAEDLLNYTLYIQALLSTLTALFAFLIARRCFGSRVAIWSAALVAFMPTFLAFSHYFMSETLYTALFLAVPTILVLNQGRLGFKRALLAGLVGGVATLTKSQFLTLAPFVVLWILIRGRDALGGAGLRAATFVGGLLLVVLPWTIRNTLRYEHFLMVDSNPGNVLYKNWNVLRPENHDVGMFKNWGRDRKAYTGEIPMRPRSTEENIAWRNADEVKSALSFTFSHPVLLAKHSIIRAQDFFNPTSVLVRGIRKGHYVWLPHWATEALVWLVLLSTGGVLAFSVIGLVARPPTGPALLPGLLLLGCSILCVFIISTSRYRLPMMPLLIPFAVNGVMNVGILFRERWRLVIAVPVLLFMVVAWVRYIPLSF
jgi:4-amino-4-deoxy-L-arabinose transferase-like glycosyltransferase